MHWSQLWIFDSHGPTERRDVKTTPVPHRRLDPRFGDVRWRDGRRDHVFRVGVTKRSLQWILEKWVGFLQVVKRESKDSPYSEEGESKHLNSTETWVNLEGKGMEWRAPWMPKVLLFFISLCRFNPTYQNFQLKIEKSQVSSNCKSKSGKTALLAAAPRFPGLREDGGCLTVLKPPPCTSPPPHVGCYSSVKSHENMLLRPFYFIYHISLFPHPMVIFVCHLMIKHYFNYCNYKYICSMSTVKERRPKDFSLSNM